MRRADSDLEFQRNLYDFLINDTYYFPVNTDLYEGSGIKGYYNYVNKLYKSSLGGSSLSNDDLVRSYIPLYCYATDGEKENLETVIADFVTKTANGVIWIVGEAGSGKTTMCLKAVNSSDQSIFSSNRVYWVRFIDLINNDGSNDSSDIEFYRELIWNNKNDTKYPKSTKLEIEKNSILYIDGYDEISIEDLERLCINVKEVSGTLFEFAKKYNLHIIVTSRPNAIEGKYQGYIFKGKSRAIITKG